MNRGSKSRVSRMPHGGRDSALPILESAMEQGKSATFEREMLHEMIKNTESFLQMMEAEVEVNENFSEMASLLKSASEAAEAMVPFSLQPEEVSTWVEFIYSVGKAQAEGTSTEKQIIKWMQGTPENISHPLDFERDTKKDYGQGLQYESGNLPYWGLMKESAVQENAKPYFFHLLATIEKLKACGKQRISAKMSCADVCAISLLLNEFYWTNERSRGISKGFNKSYLEARRRINSAASAGRSLTMSRLDLRAISTAFDYVAFPKHMNSTRSQNKSEVNSATSFENDCKPAPAQGPAAEEPTDKDPSIISKSLKKRIVNFLTKAKQGRNISVDSPAAAEILDICHFAYVQGFELVDWTEDPLHPQVTAMRKLSQLASDYSYQLIVFDTEEIRSISAIFHAIPQRLRDFDDDKDDGLATDDMHFTDPFLGESTPPAPNAPKLPLDDTVAIVAPHEDSQPGKFPRTHLELQKLSAVMDNKIRTMIHMVEEDIDRDLWLLPCKSHTFISGLSYIENGIVNHKRNSQKALEEAESLREMNASTSEAKISSLSLSLAESTRSASEAHTKLKSELDIKILRLESEVRITKSDFGKLKTAKNKQQGLSESLLSAAKKEAVDWKAKCNAEVEKRNVLRLDYEALSQAHEAFTSEMQSSASIKDAKIAAQEEELAVLRSHRTNPTVERDIVNRAVASAVATVKVELDKKQKELNYERLQFKTARDKNEETMKGKNIEITDLRESLAVMENLQAESRTTSV